MANINFLSLFVATTPICGNTDLTEQSGTINSPGWPNKYPNDAECEWQIQCESQQTIEIIFNSFEIESHVSSCR